MEKLSKFGKKVQGPNDVPKTGDFIIYRTDRTPTGDLDSYGLVLVAGENINGEDDETVSVTSGDSLDACLLGDIKSIIPGNNESLKLALEIMENIE